MPDLHSAFTVAVIALVTAGLRFLPFLIFGENRKTPPLIAHLAQVLPFAIMGMLVVYCLKDVSLTSAPFGIPEAMGVADKEVVKVKIDSERTTEFDDVVVRVSPSFALAMHIDTDEANAACAFGACYGEVIKK